MAKRNTVKKAILSETLSALFVQVESDLTSYEETIALGAKATLTLENSSEALLRGILNVNDGDKWVFSEDRKPYEEVKAAVLDRAKDKGISIEIPGSIASGKWRKEARDSNEPLIRLAGRLAGRLSTLMSKDKDNGGDNGGDKDNGDKDNEPKYKEDSYDKGRNDMLALLLVHMKTDKEKALKFAETLWEAIPDETKKKVTKRIESQIKGKEGLLVNSIKKARKN